jgi:hypothetical protein
LSVVVLTWAYWEAKIVGVCSPLLTVKIGSHGLKQRLRAASSNAKRWKFGYEATFITERRRRMSTAMPLLLDTIQNCLFNG